MASSTPTYFYLACRSNELDQINLMLGTMTTDEINRLEITGPGESTALHAASYCGHYQVVKLLLVHGADPTIKNFNQATAVDEAPTRDIQCLFRQHMKINDQTNSRFAQSEADLEWIAVDQEVIRKASHYRHWLKVASNNMELSVYTIISDYLEKKERLRNEPKINQIRELFLIAAETHDPRYIVQAYTMETDFYKCLNEDLAATTAEILNSTRIFDRIMEEFWNTHGRIAGIIMRHPQLQGFRYCGLCYRGMLLDHTQLYRYELGRKIMSKFISSSSRLREGAEAFALRDYEFTCQKLPTLCIYTIINQHSALDIARLSVFPQEAEVIIAPFCVFEIKSINYQMFELKMDDGTTRTVDGREIELEECQLEREHSGCLLS